MSFNLQPKNNLALENPFNNAFAELQFKVWVSKQPAEASAAWPKSLEGKLCSEAFDW